MKLTFFVSEDFDELKDDYLEFSCVLKSSKWNYIWKNQYSELITDSKHLQTNDWQMNSHLGIKFKLLGKEKWDISTMEEDHLSISLYEKFFKLGHIFV